MEPTAVTPSQLASPDSALPPDDTRCAACAISQRYRSLIDVGPSAIVCLSTDSRIVEFNHAAERLLGRQRSEAVGRNYMQLFPAGGEQRVVAGYLEQALAGEPIRGVEGRVCTPRGDERVLLWSMSRILDADGAVNGIITVGKDVTELKRTEDALRRYKHIVLASRDFIAFVDLHHVARAVNAAWLEASGRRRDEVEGQELRALVGDEIFSDRIRPKLECCLAGERVSCELWLDFPRLGHRCLDVHFNPFRDVHGTVSGAVVIARDITARQQADQALLKQKEQLRTLASELALAEQRERRRVAFGLHDQVGQALAVAKLKLRTALDTALPAAARQLLEEGEGLLNQCIQATRSLTFELGSAVLQELGLVAALGQLVEWFGTRGNRTRFVFATAVESEDLSEDQHLLLYDMARELLFNAERHAQANTVKLSVARTGDLLQIIVEDDGVGFDPARLDNCPGVEGGFGHFSIRERLSCLGGELQVKSSVGDGTRIVIGLPRSAADVAATVR